MGSLNTTYLAGGRGEPDSKIVVVTLSGTGTGVGTMSDFAVVRAALEGYSYGSMWISAISGTGASISFAITSSPVGSADQTSGIPAGASNSDASPYFIGSKVAANSTPWFFNYLPNYLYIHLSGTSGAISATVHLEMHRFPVHSPSHFSRR